MERMKIKDGIELIMINDKKFKSFRECVMIHRPLKKDEVTLNTVLAAVMRMQSKKYRTSTQISENLENLYGADLIARASKYGERQVLKFGIQAISDSALSHSGNFDGATDMLYDILINAGTGSAFSKEITETEKKNIADAISSQKNDKRTYSVLRIQEEMCKDEAYSINPLGYLEKLEEINENNLYPHYKKVLAESKIHIVFTGNFEREKAKAAANKIAQALLPRTAENIKENNRYSVAEVKTVVDTMDVTQGKLCMGFRCAEDTTIKNYPAVIVFNAVFGGTPTSKLFENVREKLSLCYYVTSSIDRLKEVMIVRSGVEFDSFTKAYDEIMCQLEKMKNGEITDEEINAAKSQLTNAYRSNYDSIRAMEEYYTMQMLMDTDTSIDEMCKAVTKVTKEEIACVASKVQLDTVYKLKGE